VQRSLALEEEEDEGDEFVSERRRSPEAGSEM